MAEVRKPPSQGGFKAGGTGGASLWLDCLIYPKLPQIPWIEWHPRGAWYDEEAHAVVSLVASKHPLAVDVQGRPTQ